MRIPKGLVICCSAALLSSCTSVLPPLVSFARFAPPVDGSFQFGTNTVVYGRFQNHPDMGFGNQIALRLRNESSRREYLIRLREKDPVYGISVQPGRYRIAGFVATFVDHRTAGRRTYRNTPVFEVQSNSVVYIGDFTSFTQGRVISQSWNIKGLTNNFAATTDEFRQKNPNSVPTSVVSAFDLQPE